MVGFGVGCSRRRGFEKRLTGQMANGRWEKEKVWYEWVVTHSVPHARLVMTLMRHFTPSFSNLSDDLDAFSYSNVRPAALSMFRVVFVCL